MVKPYDDRLDALERQVALLTAFSGGSGGAGTGESAGGGAGPGVTREEMRRRPSSRPVTPLPQARPVRTGYRDEHGDYHPAPDTRTFADHADRCAKCNDERSDPDSGYVTSRPPWYREIPIPAPPAGDYGVRLGRWARFCAWLRYRSASWPIARTVRR